jgi:hypothetical protein
MRDVTAARPQDLPVERLAAVLPLRLRRAPAILGVLLVELARGRDEQGDQRQ